MAAEIIALTGNERGVFHFDDVPAASSKRANELLQQNHDRFHIVWQAQRNLHNHQAHYLLTYLALGATPEQLQEAYDTNAGYLRDIDVGDPGRHNVVTEENYVQCLGRDDHYWALLKFFEAKIGEAGWKEALIDTIFAQDARGQDLLYRLYEGALHPLIHLGFGLEFEQPAIIAEALAQAAIHPGWCGPFLKQTAEISQGRPTWTGKDDLKDLFLEAHADPTIMTAPCFNGRSFERNGNFFLQLPPALVDLAARYRLNPSISPAEFHLRTVELLNVSAWATFAAQKEGKVAKIDFFLMHTVTSSIFFSVFERQDWLPLASKIELLEYQARMILVLYACQGAPEIRMDLVKDYTPRRSKDSDWAQLIEAAKGVPDDGHVLKVVRALNHAQLTCADKACQALEARGHFPFPVQSWITAAHMTLDSTEDHLTTPAKWLRGPGWDEAWEMVPNKKVFPKELA